MTDTADTALDLVCINCVSQTVLKISNLKGITGAFSSNNARNMQTALGYAKPGNRDGGIFFWTDDTTSEDDGGTIIVPEEQTPTGCWKRLYNTSMVLIQIITMEAFQ